MLFRASAGIVILVFVLLWLLLLLFRLLIVLGGTGSFSQFAHARLNFNDKTQVVVILHDPGFHLGKLEDHGLLDRTRSEVQVGQVFDPYPGERKRKGQGKEGHGKRSHKTRLENTSGHWPD